MLNILEFREKVREKIYRMEFIKGTKRNEVFVISSDRMLDGSYHAILKTPQNIYLTNYKNNELIIVGYKKDTEQITDL